MRFILALALASAAVPAVAAPTIFFGEDINANGVFVPGGNAQTARNSFAANLVGVGTEDFESFATNDVPPFALTFPGSTGNIVATLNGTGNIASGLTGAGRFPTSGTQHISGVTNGFTIDFSSPISAFGFYGTDIGDFNGQITLSLTGTNNFVLVVPNTVNGPNASLLFYGLYDEDNSFTSITFGNTAAGSDQFGFDDLIVGDLEQIDPVPAPAALALFGLGLSALGLRRR